MAQPKTQPVEIVLVHLLDGYTGSPRILREVIGVVRESRIPAKLYLGSPARGFLADCGIPTVHFPYPRAGLRPLNLLGFLFSQAFLFLKLLFDSSIGPKALVYVNTIRPCGAALYGRLTGRKVIYHLHEISHSKDLLLGPLRKINQWTSSLNIYVSDFHLKSFLIPGPQAKRVYSSLDRAFLRTAARTPYSPRHDGFFNLLMVSSLRDFKGIPELLKLASSLESQDKIRFHLLASGDKAALNRYFRGKSLPPSLTLHSETRDTASLYRKASVVLNLTRPDSRLETFGLTILEAMAFGVPVIVPPLGGPRELVEEGLQGYRVDSGDGALLEKRVLFLFKNGKVPRKMSAACRRKAAFFKPGDFKKNILGIVKP